jgi:hypothetical protein
MTIGFGMFALFSASPRDRVVRGGVQRRRQRGAFAVMAAIAMPLLVGILGLALDTGLLYVEHHRVYGAASAAALEGAASLAAGSSLSDISNSNSTLIQSIRRGARQYGYEHGVNGVSVTARTVDGYSDRIQIDVSLPSPTLIMKLFGNNSATVSTSSIARVSTQPTCLYVLGNQTSGQSNALKVGGSTNVTASCAARFGFALPNNVSTLKVTATGYTGSTTTDPLLGVSAPTVGSCGSGSNFNNRVVTGSATLNPGVYCGGLSLKGSGTVTLNPGVYIIAGRTPDDTNYGLKIDDKTVNGTNVTIYLTRRGTSGNAGTYMPMFIGGNAVVSLSAPTTGSYAGVAIFQDRSLGDISEDDYDHKIDSNAKLKLKGAVYLSNGRLTVDSNAELISSSSGSLYNPLIVKALETKSNAVVTLAADYSSLPSTHPLRAGGAAGSPMLIR